MSTSATQKYRNLGLVQGGTSGPSTKRGRRRGPRNQTAAEMYLDREMRTLFVRWADRQGNVPNEAVYNVRRGLQHPWRPLARQLVKAHAAGVTYEAARVVVTQFVEWVDKLYAVSGETVNEVVLHQSPLKPRRGKKRVQLDRDGIRYLAESLFGDINRVYAR